MKKLILTILLVGLIATPALANPATFGDGGVALQGVLDGITTAPVPGSSSVNVLTDDLSDAMDSYWNITASGGSVTTMIVEIASFATHNNFGVYDAANPANFVQVFAGGNVAGDQATLSIQADGSIFVNHVDSGTDFAGTTFGYYLDSSYYANGGFWYSDTSLNADCFDHMYAYQGKDIDTVQIPPWGPGTWTNDEYVLAFEDLHADHTDADYTDMVLMVESVMPIPAPGAILLGGIGVGLVGWLRRRRTL